MSKSTKKRFTLVYKTSTTPFFPICLVGGSYSRKFDKLAGVSIQPDKVLAVINNGILNWFFPKSLSILGRKVVLRLVADKRQWSKLIKIEKGLSKKLADLIQGDIKSLFTQRRLNKNGETKLRKIFSLYSEYSYYIDVPGFLLQLYFTGYLKRKLFKIWRHDSLAVKEIKFNLLLSSAQLTNYERFIKKLVRHIHIESSKDTPKTIADNFYWLLHDYLGEIITDNYVIQQLQLIRQNSADYKSQIKSAENRVREIRNLIKRLPTKDRQLVNGVQALLYLYNEKKKVILNKVNIYLRQVISFIYPSYSISQLRQIYQLMPEELISLLKRERSFDFKRRDHSAVYEIDKGQINLGDNSYINLVAENSFKYLRGLPASSGKVRGRVCVILNISHIPQFRSGSILVAPFTNVNYLPIMRKAKAILTETGGITSHAAIVSRELTIPCVVGIKNLIASLKDGDLVEIDANKGIVRKL